MQKAGIVIEDGNAILTHIAEMWSSARAVREMQENGLKFIPASI